MLHAEGPIMFAFRVPTYYIKNLEPIPSDKSKYPRDSAGPIINAPLPRSVGCEDAGPPSRHYRFHINMGRVAWSY
ncbi:hypothetical protein PDE_00423 [Penicillium oxalicum 114-2]|uniref:Uncharacterized protein n=1 Tax=Penicillium oxalicum (strain 114-2 / CGMCC 5302) TaxID=933388 RepID=S7Z4P6_PENO1|nr:hypothetical protein PDE_00423 [Penicillium oxalicum 114-2]